MTLNETNYIVLKANDEDDCTANIIKISKILKWIDRMFWEYWDK